MESDARANALYWGSDKGVNQIAEELDLSKGMLYGMIRPLPAELPCPRCASGTQYTNRTARERGLLTCSACGLEIDEAAARAGTSGASAAPAPGPVAPPPPSVPERAIRRPDGARDPLVVGAGLLLIAAGLWLFRGLKRR